jgi:hypothetical protein
MPFDLLAGILLIAALSVLACIAARRLQSDAAFLGTAAFLTSLFLALLYAWTFSGKLGWAAVLPAGWVLVGCNLMPVLLSFTAGLASKTAGLARWHRPATIVALVWLATAYAITPMMRPLLAPIQLARQTTWLGELCLQSHSSSCAPAAAATLLRLNEIEADEQALSDACLTSRQGTEPLGLYGGLAATSYAFGLRPHVASSDPNDWMERNQLPNIALVRLSSSPEVGSLRRLLGPRAEGHAVVVLGRDRRGNWSIADPAFGTTTWSDPQFRDRFTGDAIYLVRNR